MPMDRKLYEEDQTSPEDSGIGDVLLDVEEEDTEGPLYSLDDKGNLVEVDESKDAEKSEEPEWDDNLAEYVDEQELDYLGPELVRLYREDRQDRAEWEEGYKNGMRLIGLKLEERNDPWPNACGAFHPLLAEAIVRYVSEAIMEAFPPTGPANTSIIGKQTPELLKRAKRVKDELNYQLTVKMPEARPELEMTFFRQAVAGSCFRKSYKDPLLRRPTQRMVPAEDLVVCYGTSDLQTSPRFTHVERVPMNDIRKLMRLGFYRKIDLVESSPEEEEIENEINKTTGMERPANSTDRRRLDMYVDLDLAGFEDTDEDGEPTGVELPYIVTIDLDSEKILAIRRNHSEDNPYAKKDNHFSEYHYIRGYGYYGFGLLHLLGGTADTLTSILRQLVDAGTLSNIPAGFKGKGLRMANPSQPLAPGELRDVEVLAGTLKDQIVWAQTKEPSAVLMNLMAALVDEGRRIGSVADMKIADQSQNTAVGTTLAVLERVMRVMSAVQARNNTAITTELNILQRIICEQMPPEYDYPVDGDYNRHDDFGPPISVIPVADPNATTISQRLIRYRAAIDLASTSPHLYDMALLHRAAMETMQIPNADKIVPLKDDFDPLDPVTENMNIMMMRPVKAFLAQDHEAHLQVHMAAMQDPLIMQMVGQNPNAALIQAAASAHVQEHVAYAYRRRMEEAAGFSMPDPQNPVPPEIEAQMAPLIAAAAAKVLQRDTAEAARQEAAQQAQDPLLQIEQQKLALKDKELELRAMEAKAKIASDDRKLEMQQEIAEIRASIEAAKVKLKEHELRYREQSDARKIDSHERIEGTKLGASIAHNKEKVRVEREKAVLTARKNDARKPKSSAPRKRAAKEN